MERVFLDANIFFAAARSPRGGSGFILELAKKNRLTLVTVTHALLEAERNIKNKLDNSCLRSHYQNLLETKPEIQVIEKASLEAITKLERLVPPKDIPILLGAILSNPQFLITLDRKDFLDNEKLKAVQFPFEISNPGDFLKRCVRR